MGRIIHQPGAFGANESESGITTDRIAPFTPGTPIAVVGDQTVSGTLGVTGAITATAGVVGHTTAAGMAATAGAGLVGILDTAGTITGTTVEAALVELSARVRTQLVTVTLAAAAEAGNAIAVTINAVDLAGTAVERAQRLLCQVFDAAMLAGVAAAWTMAETGAGAEVSTTAKPSLLIDTDASGDAIVTVTDVSGVYSGDVYLVVTPIAPSGTYAHGTPAVIALTFA